MPNLKLLEYALLSIMRRRWKQAFVFIMFTLLITFALSIFSITSGLRAEAEYSVGNLPDITVQRVIGGRQQYISTDALDHLVVIPGVISAYPRVWGFYNFEYLGTNLTIMGVDMFEPDVSETLQLITDGADLSRLRDDQSMYVGSRLSDIIMEIYNKREFSFQKPDGSYLTLYAAGIFKTASQMISTDTVLTSQQAASDILGIPEGYCTDIAINVANPQEISTIAEKIENTSPEYQAITKEVIVASYQNMFDYKGGMFLLFFISALLTFFIIIFDRLSNISGSDTRETAIMKSVGWSTPDVLKVKLYEAAIVTTCSYLTAILLSCVYVYLLQAPGLKSIFTGYSYLRPELIIPFTFDPVVYISVFFITVPVYAASVIIPSWRAASADPGEIVR